MPGRSLLRGLKLELDTLNRRAASGRPWPSQLVTGERCGQAAWGGGTLGLLVHPVQGPRRGLSAERLTPCLGQLEPSVLGHSI